MAKSKSKKRTERVEMSEYEKNNRIDPDTMIGIGTMMTGAASLINSFKPRKKNGNTKRNKR